MRRDDKIIENLHKIDAIRVQQERIFEKAKYCAVNPKTIKETLENICFEVSQIMDCERVSIWLFNEDRTVLHSQNSYNDETKEHVVDEDLRAEEFAAYFTAIQSHRTLAVVDINQNEATKGIVRKFLGYSGNYHSLLDACIILGSGIGGVLCCESRERREWNTFDRMIISSIADMLSFLFDRLSRIDFEENIHRLAFVDELTGMKNYNAFLTQVASSISPFDEQQEGIFLYMNIDQFIDIQSALGPELADEIIQTVAKRFQHYLDMPHFISRIAFDHFILFVPYGKYGIEFTNKMEGLMKKLNEPILVAKQEVYLTFSYGVAYYPKDVRSPIDGVQAARFALETSKHLSSRKSVGIYNVDMHNHMKQAMMSEMNLRRGLDMNEFSLFYQPQVLSETGEIIGFEALIRWHHPEYGLIYPADFIELAESTGFILSIGEWVIRQATEKLKIFKVLGLHDLTISINLSPRHFLQDKLPTFLQECLEEAQISPSKLVLEITESVALERHDIVQKQIQTLSDQGYSIAIDDFGTGYSAFIYLQSFPIKQLKIDRTFIMNIVHDEKSRTIVKTIIQLGKTLNIRTVAEGVETKEQWEILKDKECDELQGFYFAKPLNEQAMAEMLENLTGHTALYLPLK
ncbi:sensor domain-containing phosphodiesterase [Sporosarcina newyorkensis]|uniref:Diguanylate cyclase (GGDEF) domain-containing protein n=1 Tax=Sporosarcina newyorkensis TaxID=759851 RepID=A0A1T4Y2B8_9BACL|nr:sensor domain-containing phosphodiesterase [Sporosarcina newyorkensis]SKA95435.1 diguanylate cyclase (GGDEF) domain-containing protein [Sporosarcina newyorkensis]